VEEVDADRMRVLEFEAVQACRGKVEASNRTSARRESRMVLAAGAVKIGILVFATVVFIVVYSFLADFLQRRGP
jgi:hypothetical protein